MICMLMIQNEFAAFVEGVIKHFESCTEIIEA